MYVASTHANSLLGRIPKCHYPTAQLTNLRWKVLYWFPALTPTQAFCGHSYWRSVSSRKYSVPETSAASEAHFTSSKTYRKASLVIPTQSYNCSLSLWECWLWLGFVWKFLRRLPLKWARTLQRPKLGPVEKNLFHYSVPRQSPEYDHYVSQYTSRALAPQYCFAYNIKRKHVIFSQILQ